MNNDSNSAPGSPRKIAVNEMSTLTVQSVNALGAEEFVKRFGGIAEHSPWVASQAEQRRPFVDRTAMVDSFTQAVTDAQHDQQLALLRAHPDLAGRAAVAKQLTDDSQREQAGAGLNQLTTQEFARFTECNNRYQQRFGFPFIFAVRGATKDAILAAFEQRLGREVETEFDTALEQVRRIIRFRLEDQVAA